MPKRIRLSDESVNTYGFRMLMSGWMNRDLYEANNIMLYNHLQAWRGLQDEVLPIGNMTDITIEGSEMTGLPVFDMEDDFAKKIAGKYDRGVIKSASLGIRVIETSDDPNLMLPGQRRSTVTKWELREVSIVDIPSNKRAVMLYDEKGEAINLSDDGNCPIPLVNKLADEPSNKSKDSKMNELQIIAGLLGLESTASLKDCQDKIKKLTDDAASVPALTIEITSLKDAAQKVKTDAANVILSDAIKQKKITEEQRPMYASLLDRDFDNAKALLEGLGKAPQQARLKDIPSGGSDAPSADLKHQGKTFKEWQREKGGDKVLSDLKKNDTALFEELRLASYPAK